MFGRTIISLMRKLAISPMVAALLLFAAPHAFAASAPRAASDLHVHVSVKIVGHIEGVDEHTLAEIAEHALEAAHIIAEHHGGSGVVELHIEIHGNDNHHGFHFSGHGGEWGEEEDADVVDHIDDVLVEMVHHFIDKVSHH